MVLRSRVTNNRSDRVMTYISRNIKEKDDHLELSRSIFIFYYSLFFKTMLLSRVLIFMAWFLSLESLFFLMIF